MKLKKMVIKNYKKLKDVYLEFGMMNVIIGENNAGKTTLLEVINAFLKEETKIFKDYKNTTDKDFSIEIWTTKSKYYLDASKATPIWTREVNAKTGFQKENYEHGFIRVHTTTEELEEILQDGAIGHVKVTAKKSIEEIEKYFKIYEISTDLSHTSIIVDSNETNYSLSFGFDIKKAVKVKFNDQLNSIKNKGLGQQKEFVLKQLVTETPFEVSILLIDEIENSLSMKATKEIIEELHQNEELQVFYSTHNSNTIIKDVAPNIISLGNEIPLGILNNLEDAIFVEGPTDATVFKDIFPEKLFIPSGGANIVHIINYLKGQSISPKAIVDGDDDGVKYVRKLKIKIPEEDIHQLVWGTIEDYSDDTVEKENFLREFSFATPYPKNILQSFNNRMKAKIDLNFKDEEKKAIKNNRRKKDADRIKKELQSIPINKSKLRQELDEFINKK